VLVPAACESQLRSQSSVDVANSGSNQTVKHLASSPRLNTASAAVTATDETPNYKCSPDKSTGVRYIQGGTKTRGHRLMTIILPKLNRLKFFSLKDFLVSLQLNGY